MKKEFKRHKSNRLLFNCICGSHHSVEFDYDTIANESDKDWMEYWVSVINDGNCGLFKRIKDAIKYVFKGGKFYWCEVGLNSRDLKRIKKHIDKYLEELKK